MICNDSFTQLVLYGSFVPLPVAMGGLRTTGYVATSVGVIALLGRKASLSIVSLRQMALKGVRG